MKKSINNQPFPVLNTERLVLDRLTIKDSAEVFKYQSNREHFRYVDMPVYTDVSEVDYYLEKMDAGIDENRWVLWAIRLNGVAIGTISLWNYNEEDNVAEVGYGLFSHRGNGYMTEALGAVLTHGFDTIGLSRIEAFTNKMNKTSIGLLKRCNFEYVSEFLEVHTSSGVPMEMVIYKSEG